MSRTWLSYFTFTFHFHSLQYSGLENSMDCIVHGSQRVGHDWATFTFTFTFSIHVPPNIRGVDTCSSGRTRKWTAWSKYSPLLFSMPYMLTRLILLWPQQYLQPGPPPSPYPMSFSFTGFLSISSMCPKPCMFQGRLCSLPCHHHSPPFSNLCSCHPSDYP